MRSPLVPATLLVALTVASSASAQPRRDDDALYAQGAVLRAQHRDEEALALYRQLHERTQAPRALAQVALAEGAIGRWVDAESHLVEAAASATSVRRCGCSRARSTSRFARRGGRR